MLSKCWGYVILFLPFLLFGCSDPQVGVSPQPVNLNLPINEPEKIEIVETEIEIPPTETIKPVIPGNLSLLLKEDPVEQVDSINKTLAPFDL